MTVDDVRRLEERAGDLRTHLDARIASLTSARRVEHGRQRCIAPQGRMSSAGVGGQRVPACRGITAERLEPPGPTAGDRTVRSRGRGDGVPPNRVIHSESLQDLLELERGRHAVRRAAHGGSREEHDPRPQLSSRATSTTRASSRSPIA